jgi:hypothetical protein
MVMMVVFGWLQKAEAEGHCRPHSLVHFIRVGAGDCNFGKSGTTSNTATVSWVYFYEMEICVNAVRLSMSAVHAKQTQPHRR